VGGLGWVVVCGGGGWVGGVEGVFFMGGGGVTGSN